MEWNEYFRNIVEQVKMKSKDNSTKIGVVIVGPDHEIVSTGYNSFPRGINDNVPERQERPEKYLWFEHAERNAIYNAARIGVSTKGCTMYMSCVMSCPDCARAIINSGITKIVTMDGDSAKGTQFNEHTRSVSMQMFKEAGVIVERYNGSTDGIDAEAELLRLFREETKREMETEEYKASIRDGIRTVLGELKNVSP